MLAWNVIFIQRKSVELPLLYKHRTVLIFTHFGLYPALTKVSGTFVIAFRGSKIMYYTTLSERR